MSRDYATSPRTQIRRNGRAVNDEAWMKALLQCAPFGILATVHDGHPFLNSNLFIYDETEHAIYMHTAQLGRTRANIEIDDRVCFSVYEMGRLLPADTALHFSVEYASIVIFGTSMRISDKKQATDALHLLLHKYVPNLQPGQDYRAVVPEELTHISVYRTSIDEWSGKKKEAPTDFPGAYTLERQMAEEPFLLASYLDQRGI